MSYRKFKLINDVGEELDLSNPKKIFLADVKGLGESNDFEYINDNGFLKIVSRETSPMEITGVLNFGDDVASAYRNFLIYTRFIKSSKKIELAYTLPLPFFSGIEKSTVYAEIEIKELTKSEVIETWSLSESITYLRVEPWHNKQVTKVIVSDIIGGNKYDPDQEYDTDVEYASFSNTLSYFHNYSNDYIPFEFFINGESINPIVRFRDVSTMEISAQWQYLGIIDSNNKLHHNSHPSNQYILMNDISNVYANVNMSPGFSTLLMIPPGSHTIEYISDNDDFGDLVAYKKSYWGIV